MLLLTKVANFLEKVFSWASYRVKDIGVTVLVGMVLLVVTDVVLRRFFNRPFTFTYEVVQVLLCVVVFFAVAYTGTQRAHISVDVLVSRFPAKTQAIIDVAIRLVGIALFSFVGWHSIVYGIHVWDIGQSTAVLGIPLYPFVFVVAFGSFLLALVLLTNFLHSIIEVVSK